MREAGPERPDHGEGAVSGAARAGRGPPRAAGRPRPRPLPGARATGLTTTRVLAAAGLMLAGALAARAVLDRPPRRRRVRPEHLSPGPAEARAGARRAAMNSAAMLSASVLLDSATEHFRGNYHNRAMYIAPAVAGATLAATTARAAAPPRASVFALAGLTGLAGLGFHVYNTARRPGGFWRMNNLFYAAPLGAPGGLLTAGLYGLAGGTLDRASALAPRDEGRLLGAFTAFALIVTSAEVGLLHFRGAFQNRAMLVPVTLPPAAGLALTAAAVRPGRRQVRLARGGCRLTLAAGAAGVAFHAWGVHRNHGGWGNWRQNLVQGPPLFAPPAYIGLALAGLGAVRLIESAGVDGRQGGERDGRWLREPVSGL